MATTERKLARGMVTSTEQKAEERNRKISRRPERRGGRGQGRKRRGSK
jgi:hypothetical protein